MSIFVAHAPADHDAAEALENFIERRGQFAELDDGQTALRPVHAPRRGCAAGVAKIWCSRRCGCGWSSARSMPGPRAVVVVKLDHGFAPVGLRDLPASMRASKRSASSSGRRSPNAIRFKLKSASRSTQSRAPRAESRSSAEVRRIRAAAGGLRCSWLALHPPACCPALARCCCRGAIWLANRIGPTPGTLADLIRGIDAFGVDRGAPAGATPILFAIAITLVLLAPLVLIVRNVMRRAARQAELREHPELGEDHEAPPQPASAAPTRCSSPMPAPMRKRCCR